MVSLWCMDLDSPGGRTLSGMSAVAYIEVLSSEGSKIHGKAALSGGRGAATLTLPRDLPTGNYRICAYTSLEKERNSPEAILSAGRTISVYNTLSTDRVKDGVTVIDGDGSVPAPAFPGNTDGLQISQEGDGKISITTSSDASLSVTMFKEEGLPTYDRGSLGTILEGITPSAGPIPENFIPEYDGEIIRVNLLGPDGEPLKTSSWEELFLSCPGGTSDIYSGKVIDSKATFYTCNIYGSKDLVFTLGSDIYTEDSKETSPARNGFNVTLQSPFLDLEDGTIEPLVLSRKMAGTLSEVGFSMQIGSVFDADTLHGLLPHRQLTFLGNPLKRYILDDYTRFPTMQEVLIEFVTEIRARKAKDGRQRLEVRNQKSDRGATYYSEGPSLILLDGVPVSDHDVIYNMDPLLVKRIDIYPWRYSCGRIVYEGVADFVTYKGNMASAALGNRTRIISYSGGPPSHFPCPSPGPPPG